MQASRRLRGDFDPNTMQTLHKLQNFLRMKLCPSCMEQVSRNLTLPEELTLSQMSPNIISFKSAFQLPINLEEKDKNFLILKY